MAVKGKKSGVSGFRCSIFKELLADLTNSYEISDEVLQMLYNDVGIIILLTYYILNLTNTFYHEI